MFENRKLMELGADPSYKNLLLQTPYCITCHQETRVAFRLFQGLHPEKYQYAKVSFFITLYYVCVRIYMYLI